MSLRIGSLAGLVLLCGCSAGDIRSTATGIQQWAANGAANSEAERWSQGRPDGDDFRVPGGGAPSRAAAAGEAKDQGGSDAAAPGAGGAVSSDSAPAPAAPPPVIILR